MRLSELKTELILDLHKIGAIKFGEFKLKSGIVSPVYIDLRISVSYPNIFNKISVLMWEKIKDLKFNLLCGVPFAAVPFATSIAVNHKLPMIMCRKESKQHGTKKVIEGYFHPDDICLLVEDLITSGKSILETIKLLERSGLIIKDIIVLIDREQNGKLLLKEKGYNLHSVFTLSEVLEALKKESKIDEKVFSDTKEFIQKNQF